MADYSFMCHSCPPPLRVHRIPGSCPHDPNQPTTYNGPDTRLRERYNNLFQNWLINNPRYLPMNYGADWRPEFEWDYSLPIPPQGYVWVRMPKNDWYNRPVHDHQLWPIHYRDDYVFFLYDKCYTGSGTVAPQA